ncbi:hypothetical protein K435DRAFT_967814 [Dendrothele bispora CBS 962.96]|uniref:Inactive metallocarboxypeptidase ECM14 n=1 Tax=Dendrothele bispora (strain CBS 962.96) TaxID=1314807 RepID=A0A4S8LS70_DENBC|nr:hypothetical protein K435DRAFT_967814 [Dendrothele bispora CBS 962.96]
MTPRCVLFSCAFLLYAAQVVSASTQRVFTSDPTSLNRTGTLHRFTLDNSHDLKEIINDALSHDLDIWRITQTHVDIYFPVTDTPRESPLPWSLRTSSRIVNPIYHSNVEPSPLGSLSGSAVDQWNLSSLTNTSYHSVYHPLYEIDSFVHEMAKAYPEEASVVHLGHSAEGREMLGLKLARVPPENNDDDKPEKGPEKPGKERTLDPTKKLGFVIMGAQHAREWVATATSLYLAHALVTNRTEDGSLSDLLEVFDFYIIPTPNPDGYDYTWESDRFWYKNRQIMGPNAKCIGLDMNRNWGYKWKAHVIGGGPTFDDEDLVDYDLSDLSDPESSFKKNKPPKEPVDPCSHWYPGHRPFEAPEANNIANYMTTLPNLVAFVDLRSYGQMLSLPYSYSCKRMPKDAEDMMEAALGAVRALKNVHGTDFTTGTLCDLLYKAPGNVIDWMYKKVGIKYTYAVHLRDTGTYGFSLPAQWIRPVGEETGNMIAYLGKFIATQMKRA